MWNHRTQMTPTGRSSAWIVGDFLPSRFRAPLHGRGGAGGMGILQGAEQFVTHEASR